MSFTPRSIDHVNLWVRDPDSASQWYSDVLGFQVTDRLTTPEGRTRIAFLSADPDHGHDIALVPAGEDAAPPHAGQVGLNHVAFRMASLDDLGHAYLRLKEKGVTIDHVSDHGIAFGVYFHDPDGNGLEVYYELPRDQWGRERPFTGGAMGRFPGPWSETASESGSASSAAR